MKKITLNFLFFIFYLATSNIVKAQNFVTTWQTTTANESITIPTTGSGYDYTIDWGDGTIENNQTADATHQYLTAGTKTISISGDFPRIYFNNSGDKEKILTIEEWGNIAWTSMQNAFYGCSNLNITNLSIDSPDLSGVSGIQGMFRNCTSFNGNLNNWTVDNITNMNNTFYGATSFNGNISSWNVEKLNLMDNTFRDCTVFNQDISNWDVDLVTTMNNTFRNCTSFNQNISGWNVEKVINMGSMFYGCSIFNQDITGWDVTLSTNMANMFRNCTSFNQNISGWDIDNVTNMNNMFRNCVSFNQDLNDWNVNKVTNMSSMFYGATSFNGNISDWNVDLVTNMNSMFFSATSFNQDISSWNVDNVTNMNSMFRNAISFDQNIGDWNVSNVTSFTNMFISVTLSVPNYDKLLKGWSTLTLQNGESFHGGNSEYCNSATERQHIIDTYGWNIIDNGTTITVIDEIDDVTQAGSYELPAPTGINVSNQEKYYTEPNGAGTEYNIGDIIQFSDFTEYPVTLYARGDCANVEVSFNLTLTDGSSFITTWQTTAGQNIQIPINGGGYNYTIDWGDGTVDSNQNGSANHTYATAGIQTISISGDFPRIHFNSGGFSSNILTIEQWGDIEWSSMENAFRGCSNLEITNTNIDSPNLSNVTNMHNMFNGATSLDTDLSNWDVSNVTNMTGMLSGVTLSTNNYDALLKNWSELSLANNVTFDAGNSQYCTAATEKQSIIDDFTWSINDGGTVNTTIDPVANVTQLAPFVLPTPTGTNITNQEKYYTQPNKGGIAYNIGDEIQFSDFSSYPISLYLSGDCTSSDVSFDVTLTDNSTFITTWQTTTNNESITIPTTGSGYDYTIDWGDGTIENNQTGNATHTYATSGIQTITISGDFPRIHFNNSGDKDKILTIEQWGDIKWTSMLSAFYGCSNLNITNTEIDTPDLSNVDSMQNMFRNCASFNGDINNWDVYNVTAMTSMFNGAISFNQDLNSWNVPRVTKMGSMFNGCDSFNGDISNWDISNVTKMGSMFSGCDVFNQDISNWNTSKVTTISSTFNGASSFNQDISNWDVSNIQTMVNTFQNATAFNQDIGNWDVSNVTTMNGMFRNAISFDQDISNWNVSNVTNLNEMLVGATLSVPNYDALLKGWSMLTLQSGEAFHAGNSEYCTASVERQQIIDNFGWNITDGGETISVIETIEDVTRPGSYELPTLIGINLSGEEKYYTEPNGSGTAYSPGEVIQYSESETYPITFYVSGECTNIEESFNLTLTDASTFITTWETTSANESITIPTSGSGYDYTIDWGDGTIQNNQNGNVTHSYATAGIHTISISGDFPRINLSSSSDRTKIQTIEQWGNIVWTSMESAFDGASNLNITNIYIDSPDLSMVSNMQNMFRGATSFDGDLSQWDVSTITNMNDMFSGAKLSTANYDALLKGWSELTLQNNINFNAGSSKYCTAAAERLSIIADFNWNINDNGEASTILDPINDVIQINSYQLPAPEGIDITNQEMYYTEPNKGGIAYEIGDEIQFSDFNSYPVTLYVSGSCTSSDVSFNLTLVDGNTFITTWETTTNNESITIPTNPGTTYDYTVDWGDGNIESNLTGDASHIYATSGIQTISISGNFPRILFNNTAVDKDKILTIEQWGNMEWSSMVAAFYGCSNLNITNPDIDTPNLSNVGSMQNMFRDCISFNGDIDKWDVYNVTNMVNLFYNCTSFTQDLTNWDVPNVTNMQNMFLGCDVFNGNISDWDVGNVANMQSMFNGCDIFNQDISKWNTSKATNTSNMFRDCISFDQDISDWNVSNVTNMAAMFRGCNVFNQDLSNWITSKVTTTNNTFRDCSLFDQDISDWNVSNVTNMTNMFNGATLSIDNYDALLKKWSTQSLQSNVNFNGGNSQYCTAAAERQQIIDNFGWSINDRGTNCSTFAAAASITQVYHSGTDERWIEITNNSSFEIPENGIKLALYQNTSGAQTGVVPDVEYSLNSTIPIGGSILIRKNTSATTSHIGTTVEDANITNFDDADDILIISSSLGTSAWTNRYDVVSDIENNASYVRNDDVLVHNDTYTPSEWTYFSDDLTGRNANSPLLSDIAIAPDTSNPKLGNHLYGSSVYESGSWSNAEPDITRSLVFNEDYEHTSTNLQARDITVNGPAKLTITDAALIVENEVTINAGAEIRLAGTAQLIQNHDGSGLVSGTGKLLVDQNSITTDVYRYNYLSSPVNSTGLSTFSVADVLKDGSTATSDTSTPLDITFTSDEDGDTTSPITISEQWIYTYSGVANGYQQKLSSGVMNPTEGFTLKGPGQAQNYTFVGTPKDGEMSFTMGTNDFYLTGNPYPSAISAEKFITDNESVIDGTIYFWEHVGTTKQHDIDGYIGGYATLNKVMGLSADNVTENNTDNNGTPYIGTGTYQTPQNYIPLGQGFFVSTTTNSGTVTFNNSQREYVTEGASSVFFKTEELKTISNTNSDEKAILKLGIDYENNNGLKLHKQLGMAFNKDYTFDYESGYDAIAFNQSDTEVSFKFPNDDENYVIAAVPQITEDLTVPLNIKTGNNSNLTFGIDEWENVDRNVYLLDKATNTYQTLNNSVATLSLEAETEYDNRFVIAFAAQTLSNESLEEQANNLIANYNRSENAVTINNYGNFSIQNIALYTFSGKLVGEANHSSILDLEQSKPSTGIYILKIVTDKGTITKKIILN